MPEPGLFLSAELRRRFLVVLVEGREFARDDVQSLHGPALRRCRRLRTNDAVRSRQRIRNCCESALEHMCSCVQSYDERGAHDSTIPASQDEVFDTQGRVVANPGSPSASLTHESWELEYVWSRGGTFSGSSSEQVVTSISSACWLDRNVSCVPQRGQKLRWPSL